MNDVTIGDSYPLPNIQDILDKLGRARFFSALDGARGYLQIPIAEDDRMKTAFSTESGHYEYMRMPFGLKSAPSTFQRLVNNVLTGLQGIRTLVYLDVVIYSETSEEHNARLREVFDRFRNHNLKLQPNKCEFLIQELNYLGHVTASSGMPDAKKVESIVNFPSPKSPTEIKSFLGLVGYYRKSMKDFSKLAKP